MQKTHVVTGFCPKLKRQLRASILYIFNGDSWEKGICDTPCSSPCDGECPILEGAPDELDTL